MTIDLVNIIYYYVRFLDEDNSGQIDFTEWATAEYSIRRATPAEKLSWAFRV